MKMAEFFGLLRRLGRARHSVFGNLVERIRQENGPLHADELMRGQAMIQDRRRHSLDVVHAKPDGPIGLEKWFKRASYSASFSEPGASSRSQLMSTAGAKPRVAGLERFLQGPLQHGDHAIRVERSALQMSFVLG